MEPFIHDFYCCLCKLHWYHIFSHFSSEKWMYHQLVISVKETIKDATQMKWLANRLSVTWCWLFSPLTLSGWSCPHSPVWRWRGWWCSLQVAASGAQTPPSLSRRLLHNQPLAASAGRPDPGGRYCDLWTWSTEEIRVGRCEARQSQLLLLYSVYNM